MDRTRHIRRPAASAASTFWEIGCDCGWSQKVSTMRGQAVKANAQIFSELEEAFVAHLPAQERQLYIMVDQRQVWSETPDGPPELLGVGNFLMPEGVACVLTSWEERDGLRFGRYLVVQTGEAGELPIGEIRTADNRVFRLDAPA